MNSAMPSVCFLDIFKSEDATRDNFLSRLFAFLSEEAVRCWGEAEQSPYAFTGRPTLWEGNSGSTIDFVLKSRADGRTFVSELKCEIAFEKHRYLTLNSIEQIKHHNKKDNLAFLKFLNLAKDPTRYRVAYSDRQGRKVSNDLRVDGAILIWGSTTDEGKRVVMKEFGFADVLSVESIISDLVRAGDERWLAYVDRRSNWCDELFDAIRGHRQIAAKMSQ